MGTNFYRIGYEHLDTHDPERHIGKRSAAGMYCWDCSQTFCILGEERIAVSHWPEDWTKACPKCGATKTAQGIQTEEAGTALELGWAKPNSQRPTGVGGVGCFTWSTEPEQFGVHCREHPDDELVVDEYNRKYTGQKFLDMLRYNCPIQYTRSIGTWFG